MYFARCEIRTTRPIARLGIFLSILASNLCFTKQRTGHRHGRSTWFILDGPWHIAHRTHECNGRDLDETRSFLFILVETCKFLPVSHYTI